MKVRREWLMNSPRKNIQHHKDGIDQYSDGDWMDLQPLRTEMPHKRQDR